jgi:hypothetical protein
VSTAVSSNAASVAFARAARAAAPLQREVRAPPALHRLVAGLRRANALGVDQEDGVIALDHRGHQVVRGGQRDVDAPHFTAQFVADVQVRGRY